MVLLLALNSGMIAILKALFTDLWTCSRNIKREQAISSALFTRHVAEKERTFMTTPGEGAHIPRDLCPTQDDYL